MHALIVDDSRATRMILGQILRRIGFAVAEAGNGREGLEQLKRLGRIDLVLVDWNMPDMSGLDFIRTVRADASHTNLRLMMVTSEEGPDQVAAARQAGADEYLNKPFSQEAILEKLQSLHRASS